ncbi:MAG: LysR family transcriptional regulator [Fluviicola sp.]|nr:LysR family transcriptional regulator [Fluviicola sp.]
MNYTLHQLQVFLKITQTQSITKAALELHLTQPAVSIQLKNFQDQFDIPLTEIQGRKLYVTDFGKEIAIAAERIIDEVHAINYKTLAYRGQLSGRLKISAVSTGKYIIPYFLSDFLKLHPGIELVLDVTNKSRVIESLEKNEVDFSLVSILPKQLQVDHEELLENKLFLIGNTEDSLNWKAIKTDDLVTVPLIFREAGSATRLVMEQFLEDNELKITRKMELTSNEAVKQAIIAGLGCSIMPLIGLRQELTSKELHILPANGLPIASAWNLIWLKNKRFSPVAEAYLSYIRLHKQQIISQKFSWYDKY